MARGADDARADLIRLAARAETFDFHPLSSVGPEHSRSSAVLVLFGVLDSIRAADTVTPVSAALDVLLLRRSPELRYHPGQVAFPGGGREAVDADASATALREAQEETGLQPGGVTLLGELTPAMLPHSDNLVTPVLGWWHRPTPIRADGTETSDVFRVPVADLLRPASRFTAVVGDEVATHRGPVFELGPQFGNVPLWGFTAMILDRIFDELGWTIAWDRTRTMRLM